MRLTDAEVGVLDATDEYGGFRWTEVTIPNGATIDVANVSFVFSFSNFDEPLVTIDFHDAAGPTTFTTTNFNISGRTRTTANETWDDADLGAPGWFTTPSLVSIIQELVDSYTCTSMVAILQGTEAARDLSVDAWDGGASDAAKLHVEFTA